MPAEENKKSKTLRCFKTKIKTNKTTQGKAFITDLFKILLGLKICGERVETPLITPIPDLQRPCETMSFQYTEAAVLIWFIKRLS